MPNWKKVITSGSDARLNSLTVDGGVTASRFNGGTFSGSFSGDGSGLTGIVASATPGGPNQSVQYNNAGTTSGSSMFRFETGTNTVFVTGSVNATSVTASFLGNLTGTASWAVSASWAPGLSDSLGTGFTSGGGTGSIANGTLVRISDVDFRTVPNTDSFRSGMAWNHFFPNGANVFNKTSGSILIYCGNPSSSNIGFIQGTAEEAYIEFGSQYYSSTNKHRSYIKATNSDITFGVTSQSFSNTIAASPSNQGIVVSTENPSPKGLVYNSDYGATLYTNLRSIPDIGIIQTYLTASYAVTSAFAVSASWAPASPSVSASYATTSSYALNADNFQINTSIITSNTNDYNPTGFRNAKIVYLCFSSGSKAITGFASGSGGMVKWFINTGSWMGYVPFEHPSSSAENRVMGSSDYLIPPGGVIHGLYDANASRWRITYSSFDLSDMVLTGKGMYYNQYPGSTNASDHPFLGLAVAGTGATNANATPSSNLPSAWDLDSGTTAAGDSTVYLIKNQLVIDTLGYAHIGAWTMVFIPTLSTSAQRFRAHFNVLTGASSTVEHVANSFGIRYCDDSSSGAWECFSRSGSNTETTQSSGITVAANTLYLLKVFAPIDLSEIRFHVSNGTSAFNTVLTNNLPTVGTTVGVRTSIHKVVGATARNLRVCNIGGYAVRG